MEKCLQCDADQQGTLLICNNLYIAFLSRRVENFIYFLTLTLSDKSRNTIPFFNGLHIYLFVQSINVRSLIILE